MTFYVSVRDWHENVKIFEILHEFKLEMEMNINSMWIKRLDCNAGSQVVSRCRARVNLRNPLHVDEEAIKRGIHPGFENQSRRNRKGKKVLSMAP